MSDGRANSSGRYRFGGEVLASSSTPSFDVFEMLYPRGLSIPPHRHPIACLAVCLSGGMTETIDGIAHEVEDETVTVIAAESMHSDDFSRSHHRVLLVAVTPEAMRAYPAIEALAASSRVYRGIRMRRIGKRITRNLRSPDPSANLETEGLVLQIFGEIASGQLEQGLPPWLSATIQSLRRRYLENLSPSILASEHGVNAEYLARTFRRHIGCTVSQFIRRIRIEQAAARLATTKETISEIALTLGFSDQSHFTRNFKQIVGTTPSQYRRMMSNVRRNEE